MNKKIGITIICIILISLTTTFFSYTTQTANTNNDQYWQNNTYYQKTTIETGSIYYVSTNGNDNNPGTQNNPFQSIQKAIDIVNPGDTVYVRGGTYNEQITLERCGTENNWITIKNYPDELPIIDGTKIQRPWGTGLVQIGQPAWSDWKIPTRGFFGVEYIIFDGFKIQNSNGVGILTSFSRYIYIQNCQIYNTWGPGIESNNGYQYPPYGNWDPQPHPHHIYIYNNYLGTGVNHGRAGEAISIVRTDYAEVMYNKVIDTCKEGIDFKNMCNYGLVAYNKIKTPDVGIYYDAQSDYQHDFIVHSNYLYGNGGIAGGNELGGTIENLYIYNNLICSSINGFGCIGTSGDRKNINIIHNTFDVGNIAIQLAVPESAKYIDLTIKNNIIKGHQGINLNDGVMTNEDFILDHNLFNSPSSTYGTNHLIGDPKWVNPSIGNYHLQPNSPAIDNGIKIDTISIDFDGNTRLYGTTVDIGAFEYNPNQNNSEYNNPPNKPTINGENNGKTSIEYTYTLVSTDPEGDEISYFIDWGDSSTTGWTRTLPSGEFFSSNHSWSEKGDYTIRAKAKDKYNAESQWATISISIPKTKTSNQMIRLFLKILEIFLFS